MTEPLNTSSHYIDVSGGFKLGKTTRHYNDLEEQGGQDHAHPDIT
jgi:hypothetical protein